MAKRKQHSYMHVNARGLHADIARNVGAFYNNVLPYAHLFPSKFVRAS